MSAFLFATVVPILTDFFKSAAPAVSRKIFGESVDDTIKLAQVDISRTEALAKLDNPYGTPSQWVIDLRGSFRYIASAILLVGGLGLAYWALYKNNPILVAAGIDLALSPSGFILGERMVLTFRGGTK